MGKKINDTSEFPATVPAAADRVLGIDVSNTGNDANGEVVTFTVEALRNAIAYATAAQGAKADTALQPGANISTLTNDAGYTTATGTVDTSGTPVALDFARFTDANTIEGLSAAEVKTALDLEIGTDVLAYDANLQGFVDNFTLPTTDGTADQVLKTDGAGNIGFATAGGGGGLVPISKTTASASAAVDIALTGGYSSYLVRILGMRPVTDLTKLWLRVSLDSGVSFDSGASDYGWSYLSQTNVTSIDHDEFDNQINIAAVLGNDHMFTAEVLLFPAVSSEFNTIGYDAYFVGSNDKPARIVGAGTRKSTTAMTNVRFFMSSGNIDVGDFHLYGIADGA